MLQKQIQLEHDVFNSRLRQGGLAHSAMRAVTEPAASPNLQAADENQRSMLRYQSVGPFASVGYRR